MDIVTYALLNGKIKDYASNVDEWLEENVDPDTGYVLDRSLQMENAAAPADMVGDINDEVGNLKNTLDHKADVIYDTASGPIASFPDGADGLPVKDLTVGIEPVQSGAGDPSPTNVRPISGWAGANVTRTGKNLLRTTVTRLKQINPLGEWTGNSYALFGVTHTILVDANENVTGIEINGTATNDVDFTLDFPLALATGISYIFTSGNSNGSKSTYYINIPYANGTASEISFTYNPELHTFARIRVKNGTTVTHQIFKPMIRFASETDPTFAPYTGTSIPISWQSEAGTVYGGTLDVTSGVLTVDKVMIAADDTWAINRNFVGTLVTQWVLNNKASDASLASILSNVFISGTATSDNPFIAQVLGSGRGILFTLPNDTASSSYEAKQYLINNGVQFVYELATPQTYQLTPTDVITTLLGQNNIWSDTGSSTVEYPADTKLYIQKINAPTDDDMIADANIASGQYFIVNNNLYLSTTAILAGDPIKPGTNCTLTNLAAALNAINS